MSREGHLVELVDAAGHRLGESTVAEAHQQPGRLHRAFSVLLLDPAGRLLLQRRAASKTRFPLRWANSCCGHPAPGGTVSAAAARRLDEELGVTGVPFTEIGVYTYRADDAATGRVEHEYDHVLVGHAPADLPIRLDPAEVDEVRWVAPEELAADLAASPVAYAPWLAGVLALLVEAGPAGGSR